MNNLTNKKIVSKTEIFLGDPLWLDEDKTIDMALKVIAEVKARQDNLKLQRGAKKEEKSTTRIDIVKFRKHSLYDIILL